MKPRHWLVLLLFLGACVGFMAAVGVADYWIARHWAGFTISWSMALLGRSQPLFVFWTGFAVCWVVSNLAEHFWPTMIDPATDDLVQNQARKIGKLEDELAAHKWNAPS